MKISDFFKTQYVAWASYDNLRSISSIADGLRIASRKTIFSVKKKNISKDMKVSALSNTVILEAHYLHGDESLNGVISRMAQQFTGSNNLSWLTPESAFGTRQNPAPSAARYVYTRKSEWFDALIQDEDDDILLHQTFEGHNVDPKFYLPIMPMLLVNGAKGVTPGAKQLIFSRSAKKLLQHLISTLEGKGSRYDFAPHWNGFNGIIEKGATDRQWLIKGKCEIKNTTTVEITEVPIKYNYKQYIAVLDELENTGKIVNYDDYCNPKTGEYKFTVKFTRQNLAEYDQAKLMNLFKLIQTESEIYTVIDHENRICFLESIEQVFEMYYQVRLNGYHLRKQSQMKTLQDDIDYNVNKAGFIKEYDEGNINLRDDVKTIENRLIQLQISKHEGSYDYLLNMNIRSLTKDGYQKILNRIDELQKQLEYVKSTTAEQIWIDDLKKIVKYIKE